MNGNDIDAAAAVCRNAQHELGDIRSKLASLNVNVGSAIRHIDSAIECCEEAADLLYSIDNEET